MDSQRGEALLCRALLHWTKAALNKWHEVVRRYLICRKARVHWKEVTLATAYKKWNKIARLVNTSTAALSNRRTKKLLEAHRKKKRERQEGNSEVEVLRRQLQIEGQARRRLESVHLWIQVSELAEKNKRRAIQTWQRSAKEKGIAQSRRNRASTVVETMTERTLLDGDIADTDNYFGRIKHQQESRLTRLGEVFQAFDYDASGSISADEFYELGTARRSLGQKSGVWSKKDNMKHIRRMKGGAKGTNVSREEFVVYYEGVLPLEEGAFEQAITDFTEVARYLNKKHHGELQNKVAERNQPLQGEEGMGWCEDIECRKKKANFEVEDIECRKKKANFEVEEDKKRHRARLQAQNERLRTEEEARLQAEEDEKEARRKRMKDRYQEEEEDVKRRLSQRKKKEPEESSRQRSATVPVSLIHHLHVATWQWEDMVHNWQDISEKVCLLLDQAEQKRGSRVTVVAAITTEEETKVTFHLNHRRMIVHQDDGDAEYQLRRCRVKQLGFVQQGYHVAEQRWEVERDPQKLAAMQKQAAAQRGAS